MCMSEFCDFKGHMNAFPLHLETHYQICEEIVMHFQKKKKKLGDTTEKQKFQLLPAATDHSSVSFLQYQPNDFE